ncbi:hypothetical protein DDB_G0285379 [Dictyostelium discoideum AX4]|uniref:Uncharacterized protein n=1 Tax=Dictyostelium discoideum TaxID=44689 RepID=Q54N98_DICDI|nr:hypothetical protein DDB_G0285379 [Dictyostelium discoideum AX4]EAL64764.1 hypothetical protein DDB_G0285379 [Dictyostelium discoideum AX4]|eukprot:XP_638282.1 hypothetical protein DDB_G0285379 [Dictyostelium discoideum AX4]
MTRVAQIINIPTIRSSMNIYRKFIRLSYQFPKQVQYKIRLNTKEAFILNKVFLDQGSFNQKNIKSLIEKSNDLLHILSTLPKSNKPLFLKLFSDNLNVRETVKQ